MVFDFLLDRSSPSFAIPLRLRSCFSFQPQHQCLSSGDSPYAHPLLLSGADLDVEPSGWESLPMSKFCVLDAVAACCPALSVQYEMCTVELQHVSSPMYLTNVNCEVCDKNKWVSYSQIDIEAGTSLRGILSSPLLVPSHECILLICSGCSLCQTIPLVRRVTSDNPDVGAEAVSDRWYTVVTVVGGERPYEINRDGVALLVRDTKMVGYA